jgi:hypothetical protein
MKKIFLLPVLAILMASCSKSNSSSDPVADMTVKNNMVSQDGWSVTLITNDGIDITADYSNFRLNFNTDGTLVVDVAGTVYNGTWVLTPAQTKPDDSGNAGADDKLDRFTISVAGDKSLNRLSHKWVTDKITASEIWLRDDDPLSNEVLHFGR